MKFLPESMSGKLGGWLGRKKPTAEGTPTQDSSDLLSATVDEPEAVIETSQPEPEVPARPTESEHDQQIMNAVEFSSHQGVGPDELLPTVAELIGLDEATVRKSVENTNFHVDRYHFLEQMMRLKNVPMAAVWQRAQDMGIITQEDIEEVDWMVVKERRKPNLNPQFNRWDELTEDKQLYQLEEQLKKFVRRQLIKEKFPDLDENEVSTTEQQVRVVQRAVDYASKIMLPILNHMDYSETDVGAREYFVRVQDYEYKMPFLFLDGRIELQDVEQTEISDEKYVGLYEDDDDFHSTQRDREGTLLALKAMQRATQVVEPPDPFVARQFEMSLIYEMAKVLKQFDRQLRYRQAKAVDEILQTYGEDSDARIFLDWYDAENVSKRKYDAFVVKWLEQGMTLAEITARVARGADLWYNARQTSSTIGGAAADIVKFLYAEGVDGVGALFAQAAEGAAFDQADIQLAIDQAGVVGLLVAKFGAEQGAELYGDGGLLSGMLAAKEGRGAELITAALQKQGLLDDSGLKLTGRLEGHNLSDFTPLLPASSD